MSNQAAPTNHDERSGSLLPVWWLVFRQELVELWTGGRVFFLLILFTVLISVTSIMREVESQISLIPPPEMVFLTLQSIISFGLFIGLIIGADSISGERERATLEPLLLTPTNRRQLVFGKFLAALSPWPIAMLLSIPYLVFMSQGDEVLGQALLLGSIVGTMLAVAFTGFGMLVSIWSNSNKISLFVCLLVYVILLIPTQFIGQAQKGDLGFFVQQLNPMQGSSSFLEYVLVNNRPIEEQSAFIIATILSFIIVPLLLFVYAAPRLALEGDAPRFTLPRRRTVAPALLVLALVLGSAITIPPLQASGKANVSFAHVSHENPPAAPPLQSEQAIEIAIDTEYQTLKTGDAVEFNTVVTNNGEQESPRMLVAMNIINLGKGDPVDPEDWSPERTQEIEPIPPGESVEQAWEVDAILAGNYMVYMTVVPEPDGPDSTSQPISSPGIHLTVESFVRTNPGGVMPIAIGIPAALIALTLFVRKRARRSSATPASQSDE